MFEQGTPGRLFADGVILSGTLLGIAVVFYLAFEFLYCSVWGSRDPLFC